MNSTTQALAFIMGLTGSLHCAGMCGPIMLILPFQHLNPKQRFIGILLYHLGRISVYVLLALLVHSFQMIVQAQTQQYVSVSIGLLLFVAGLLSLFPTKKLNFVLPWTNFVKSELSNFIGKPSLYSLTITGFLNGLLPCGLVYMALSASMTCQSTVEIISFMSLFGFGTMPMLLLFIWFKNRIPLQQLNNFRKLVPIVMTFFGLLFIVRGMNLGIPYLSPKIEIQSNGTPAIQCHKTD